MFRRLNGWLARLWTGALAVAPLRLWAMILAGPPLTITLVLQTLIVWRGGWNEALQGQQLSILGWTLLANWMLLGVIIVTLAAVRVKGSGPAGVGFEIDADGPNPAPPPGVTTTVRTEVGERR